jgi:hypothetical protein
MSAVAYAREMVSGRPREVEISQIALELQNELQDDESAETVSAIRRVMDIDSQEQLSHNNGVTSEDWNSKGLGRQQTLEPQQSGLGLRGFVFHTLLERLEFEHDKEVATLREELVRLR